MKSIILSNMTEVESTFENETFRSNRQNKKERKEKKTTKKLKIEIV